MNEFLKQAILAAPVIIFSLTVHEFFHAWTANKFGDPTAKNMGRLTLNPLAHLDFFGTVVLFISHFRFGWAKPVPINPYNLSNPRRDDFWISAAGPLSNLGLGFIAGLLFRVFGYMHGQGMIDIAGPNFVNAVGSMLYLGVMINVSLAFFNLLPVYPLDGSHIFRGILPEEYGPMLDQVERFAPFILLVLILSGPLLGFSLIWIILGPFIKAVVYVFAGLQIPW